MKAAPFDYERPESLAAAIALLEADDRLAKVLAGGQSLGPMLNLRLAAVDLLVDVTRIPELTRVEEDDEAILLGACVTHAAIEDGEVPDTGAGALAGVARGIAYRAVRNRGTIGGSLAHADPSSDWLTCLAALGAEVVVAGPAGQRVSPVAAFMVGVYETDLAPAEIVEAIRIPKGGPGARWGFYKFCRKTGEFADAMAAVLWDPERGIRRAVLGATESTPLVVDDARDLLDADGALDAAAVGARLDAHGLAADPYARQIHAVALRRALAQARPR